MLDLDILRKKYAMISPLPLLPEQEDGMDHSLARHYCVRLQLEPGQAGYVVTDEFLFFGKIVSRHSGKVLLVGPATEYALSTDARKRVSGELGLRGRQASALMARLEATPVMGLTAFIQQLSFLNYIINQNEQVLSSLTEKPVRSLPPQNPGNGVAHNTEEFENRMLSCIRFGKRAELEEMLDENNINQYTTGLITLEGSRTLKNIFVTSTSLACRAGVWGGLDYDLALSLSDRYLLQVEGVYTFGDFNHLWRQMLLDYCSRVADLRLLEDTSELVRSAARKIGSLLYQKISVAHLAEQLQVSRSYLSHQFKRETGVSLTDYIMARKLDEAIHLMQTTDATLAQIAYQLGFSSQSYFHTAFKKYTGMNPGKYPRSGRFD